MKKTFKNGIEIEVKVSHSGLSREETRKLEKGLVEKEYQKVSSILFPEEAQQESQV